MSTEAPPRPPALPLGKHPWEGMILLPTRWGSDAHALLSKVTLA